jgi:isoleucyl-tRNA synthetase
MAKPYKTFKQLDLPAITREVAQRWENEDAFGKSVGQRSADKPFTFFEGPPSANGVPGIHHVMARTIKDIICRFKTQQGYRVLRKAGWDTHGLPVELQVEKELGITKEDIGTRISVEEYNEACKKSVMRYTDEWNRLTKEMGYWVDMENPYITYTTPYMETVWWLLKQFFDKGLLYKGYTIQPYSPAAGTGLSTHELNQPGAYREVKDLSMVAMFRLLEGQSCGALETDEEMFCLAWTTTPWTLPSNTALAVGPSITYCWIETLNPYTRLKIKVCLAEELVPRFFLPEMMDLPLEESSIQGQKMPWKRFAGCKGSDLAGLRYEQLLPYVQPDNGDAFRILGADFVRTEDGTGIVHLAPSFGADDFRAAQKEGIGSLTSGRFAGAFCA